MVLDMANVTDVPKLVWILLLGVPLPLVSFFAFHRVRLERDKDELSTIDVTPTFQRDWAHLRITNTGSKKGDFSATVRSITWDKKDSFPKDDTIPYHISWRDPSDAQGRLPLSSGESGTLNIASPDRLAMIPEDPPLVVLRLFSASRPDGFTSTMQFDGLSVLNTVLEVEVYGDPKLSKAWNRRYLLSINSNGSIADFSEYRQA